jgi:hypothetical protein
MATTPRNGLWVVSSWVPAHGFTALQTFVGMSIAASMFVVAIKAKYRTLAIAASRQSGSSKLTISEEMKCMMRAAT